MDYQLAGGSKLRKPVSDVGHFKASFATGSCSTTIKRYIRSSLFIQSPNRGAHLNSVTLQPKTRINPRPGGRPMRWEDGIDARR